ncbi:capsule polysaccharide biosynthesis protein [Xylariales sp. AK1849]|nr:capsule polysaccharide biosynthesis protein [Xylariales sp. AK1849]
MVSTSTPAFSIPEKYQNDLEYVEVIDKRSSTDILHSLSQYAPVTSERNIWGYWHAGLLSMPSWCQRNVVDWVRLNPGWSVRILDNVPSSPQYALNYVSKELLPAAFVEHKMNGPFMGPHSADFLRGACLYKYGGAYLDVGAILVRSMEQICWKELEDDQSPFRVAAPLMLTQGIANHFVAARKGDPFIKRWHDLFVFFWRGKNNADGLIEHPLLATSARDLIADYKPVAENLWDWKVSIEKATEYVTQIATWYHLCRLEDAGDGFSPCDYWQNHVFLFSCTEDWPAEALLGFAGSGQKIMDLLALRLDGDKGSEQYEQAEELVWMILAKSCMQKVTHAGTLTHSPHLGTLWDLPENETKDHSPGTFAELLRYGSVHFKQTRETIPRVPAQKPSVTWKKGLFEA